MSRSTAARSALSDELNRLLRAATEMLDVWPLPVEEESTWRAEACCRGMDPEFFFPGRGEPMEPVRAICRQCPVRVHCLASGLANGEKSGTWGGISEHERRAMRRQLVVASAESDHTRRRTA
ncbi:MAG: WhiB family transcriptional regulator [Acidimicrobiales bacterium]